MDVTRLTFSGSSFDAAITTFLFCVLTDEAQGEALREVIPVTRPRHD
jgi:ubiquinone/menaquinone biosynthesis C-methylase UbiE